MIEFLSVYPENWANWWPQINAAMLVTVQLTVCSFALAIVVGLLLALGKLSKIRALRMFCAGYIEVARGIPALAVLFLLYYGLVPTGLVLDAFVASFIGLGLSAAGYIAEVFRAGIEAVPRGQMEAARSLGMPKSTAMTYIILPQAFRIVLPATGNQFVGVLKGAAIAAVIGVADLMFFAREASLQYFTYFEFYTTAGLLLIGSTVAFAGLVALAERKMRWGG